MLLHLCISLQHQISDIKAEKAIEEQEQAKIAN